MHRRKSSFTLQLQKEERQSTYKRSIEAHSRNHFYRGNTINISYSKRVSVALFIQHDTRMRSIILSIAACLCVPYFLTLSHRRHDFLEKVTDNKMCVPISSKIIF